MFFTFPIELNSDVSIVLNLISKKTYNNVPGETESGCTYTLLDGQEVTFPYRIYYFDKYNRFSSLTFEQKMIYHCIFSRSYNGFVREKHIKSILEEDYPDWVFPYILKISDEYIIEILEIVYNELKNKNTDTLKSFCILNFQTFVRSYDRMISYWNEYYRNQCFSYKDYIGNKLFSECFGYTESMEREYKRLTNNRQILLYQAVKTPTLCKFTEKAT